jgi:hypothetical protein
MEYIVKITDLNSVTIWAGEGAAAPVILQDRSPDGNEWASEQEALDWAESEVAKLKQNTLELQGFMDSLPPVEAETPPAE